MAPSIAIVGCTNSDAENKATTDHTRDSGTGTKASDMRNDTHDGIVKSDGMTDDASLVTNVEDALKADSITSELDVDVEANAGVVTLTGQAAGVRWKTQAANIASKVQGVKSVQNDIEIGN